MKHNALVGLSTFALTFGIVVGVNALGEPIPRPESGTPTIEVEPVETHEQERATLAAAMDQAGDVDGTAGEGQAPKPKPEAPVETPKAEAPVVVAPESVIFEDDPRWDCRVMGNLTCGVEVHGETYLIEFTEAGEPASVRKAN